MELEAEIRELKEKYKNTLATLLLQEQKLDKVKALIDGYETMGKAKAKFTKLSDDERSTFRFVAYGLKEIL